jgi:Mrp family chromosome partitioning ATPase
MDVERAAGLIQKNLLAGVPKMTQIITLSFSHPNAEIVRPVLDQLIIAYKVKHAEIHQRTEEFNLYLNTQTDVRKMRLKQWEDQIAEEKSKGGFVDLNQELLAYTSQEAKIKEENYLAMAEMDEAVGRRDQLKKMMPTNAVAEATNIVSPAKLSVPTAEEQDAYIKARQRVVELQTLEAKLESTYTTNNPQVKTNLIDLAAALAKKKGLEEATPGLVVAAAAETKPTFTAPTALDPIMAYNNEQIIIAGLVRRIERQTNSLALITDRGTNLVQMERRLRELERNRQMDEQELSQMKKITDKANMDVELTPSRVTGISVSEQPTPPARDEKLMTKVVAGIGAGGLVLGLGLAFLLEMVLDRSFKRPQEVVSRLALPFFLSVPYLNGNGKLRLFKRGKQVKLLAAGGEGAPAGGAEAKALAPVQDGPIAAWDEKHALRPFHETLRDRLIAYFEMINLTHKPKLVALTSCHHGAGVSTMASGLASALSETGDGNVLLVNMNSEEGEAHHFYKGKLNMGLDDIFEKEKENRHNALVQENLYVVQEASNREKLPSIMPKRFSHLVTKMKASDYDYIIFDMPPVTQISVTPRLARFMDMVLMVVESEKTDRDVAQRASALLSESRANVGVVMNKNRSYVPKRLHQEL